jgi:hypothetical protein
MHTINVLDSHQVAGRHPGHAKLLLTIEPAGLVTADIERWARDNIAALEVESIGPAGHHAPQRPTGRHRPGPRRLADPAPSHRTAGSVSVGRRPDCTRWPRHTSRSPGPQT